MTRCMRVFSLVLEIRDCFPCVSLSNLFINHKSVSRGFYTLLHHLFLDLWFRKVSDVWESPLSAPHSEKRTDWKCAHYIWRELCVYLCNHVIQRSCFHGRMFKIRQWGKARDGHRITPWGETRLHDPSVLTVKKEKEKPL